MADVVQHPSLPDAEVDRERGVILDELAQHAADGDEALVDLLYAAAFQKHPYRRSPGGTPAQIAARGRDTLAAFHHRCYTPTNAFLVLAGDFTLERAETAARQAFGGWRAPEAPAMDRGSRQVGPTELAEPREDIVPGDVSAASPDKWTHIGLAFPAPTAREAKDVAVALVTASLLGDVQWGGRLARSNTAFREASARFTPRLSQSLFLVTASISSMSIGTHEVEQKGNFTRQTRAQEDLRAVIEGLLTSPPGAAELLVAKRRVIGRMMVEAETCGGLARAWGYAALIEGESPDALRASVMRVTRQDIARFVAELLNGRRCVTGYLTANVKTSGEGR